MKTDKELLTELLISLLKNTKDPQWAWDTASRLFDKILTKTKEND